MYFDFDCIVTDPVTDCCESCSGGGALEHFSDADHYVIQGFEPLKANVNVCTKVDAERFLGMLVGRIQGK